MITRLLTLIVIVTLALPIATLTPSGDPGQGPGSNIAMAAKGKHKKKPRKKGTAPKFTTVTRTVRQPVTQTFTSLGDITIPDNGQANPYPSPIAVSGFTNGVITDVDLILNDVSHDLPANIDVLLSSSDGRRALVMSDVGVSDNQVDVDLTLDDEAAVSLPVQKLSSGTFRPTDLNADADTFAPPAPAPSGSVAPIRTASGSCG